MDEIVCTKCNRIMVEDTWMEDDGSGTEVECTGLTCFKCGFHTYITPIETDLKRMEQMGVIKILQRVG